MSQAFRLVRGAPWAVLRFAFGGSSTTAAAGDGAAAGGARASFTSFFRAARHIPSIRCRLSSTAPTMWAVIGSTISLIGARRPLARSTSSITCWERLLRAIVGLLRRYLASLHRTLYTP